MKSKKILTLIIGAALLASQVAYAARDIQSKTREESKIICPVLSLDLKKGINDKASNGQVSELQKFFERYYKAEFTSGLFGKVTEDYVNRFQKENGLPVVGVVGAKTRQAIIKYCNNPTPLPIPLPVKSPTTTITNISGPTLLNVGEQGTWIVNPLATSSALTYSALWGDEQADTIMLGMGNDPMTMVNAFYHTYTKAGFYTATFTISNARGESSTKTLAITVVNKPASSFNATSKSGDAPLLVRFSGWTPGDYVLDFGDGNVKNIKGEWCQTDSMSSVPTICGEVEASHLYKLPGTYIATLTTVINCDQNTSRELACAAKAAVFSVTIKVNIPLPEPAPGPTTTPPLMIDKLSATNTEYLTARYAYNSNESYSGGMTIDFGDGESAAFPNPPSCSSTSDRSCRAPSITHVYKAPGTYTATLTGDNGKSEVLIATTTVTISDTSNVVKMIGESIGNVIIRAISTDSAQVLWTNRNTSSKTAAIGLIKVGDEVSDVCLPYSAKVLEINPDNLTVTFVKKFNTASQADCAR